MSDRNPSPYTRGLVLVGPTLALLATILSLAAGTVSDSWGPSGPVRPAGAFSLRSRASCGGGSGAGAGRPSPATGSPTGERNASTGQPGPAATRVTVKCCVWPS